MIELYQPNKEILDLISLPFGENLTTLTQLECRDSSETKDGEILLPSRCFILQILTTKSITIQYQLVTNPNKIICTTRRKTTASMKVNTKNWLLLVPHHFRGEHFHLLPVNRQIYSIHACANTTTLVYELLLGLNIKFRLFLHLYKYSIRLQSIT